MSKFSVGDRVKINIEALMLNGMDETSSQVEQYEYILDHPDEIYTISSTDRDAIANIGLDHDIVGKTSFFEDEIIKI